MKYCDYICSHLPVIPDFKTLDDACSKLLECVEDGAKRYLPKLKQKRPAVPGWNDSARSLHKTANLWHQIWLDCGCPTSRVLFQIKKNAKKRYKYEVRRLKRQQDHIRSELMGKALSQSRTRDFWKEVRKMTKTSKGHRITSPVIDGLSDKTEIAGKFSAKMQGLLNSTCNDHARLEVLSEINDSLNQEDMNSCSISVNTFRGSLSSQI